MLPLVSLSLFRGRVFVFVFLLFFNFAAILRHRAKKKKVETKKKKGKGKSRAKMQLFVKGVSGRTLVCDVACNSTVAALKQIIQEQEGVPCDQAKLVCGLKVSGNWGLGFLRLAGCFSAHTRSMR